jgi:hypothetical protein
VSGREVDPQAWGGLVLEDVLYRAALELSEGHTLLGDPVIRVEVRVAADRERGALTLTLLEATGEERTTALLYPFGRHS